MIRLRFISMLFLLFCSRMYAQDANLSQFFHFSPSINPAFSGANSYSRVNVGFRNQWVALNSGFNSAYVGFDHYLKPYYSGLGGFIKYDRAPSGYTNIQLQTQLSHIVQVSMKSALRAGVQLGVANNQFNLTSLVLGDQLNNDGVQNPVSIESNSIMTNSKFYFDLGLGLLYYSEKYWLGAAAHHLTQPNIGFSAGKSTLPVAWSMHAGARFYVGREKGIQREVRKTFSPSFMLRNAANQFQFDFTGIYNLQPILVGFGYRGLPLMKYNRMQNDAFMLLAGYRTSSLLIAYSYDLTISNLGLSTLGAHELGLIIEFGERGATKRGARLINTPFPLLYSN